MNVVVSCGDINGIGIEVFLKALQLIEEPAADVTIVVNPQTLDEYLDRSGYRERVTGSVLRLSGRTIRIDALREPAAVRFGTSQSDSGLHALRSLDRAIEIALNEPNTALLTLPVSKQVLKSTGQWPWPGQTEMVAERSGTENPTMMLCAESMRVGLATVHVPISQVATSITTEGITHHARRIERTLALDFGVQYPKIAILGLNPHAGESGEIGREEVEIISPALTELTQSGTDASGPFPADGFFAFGEWQKYDAILAMYHDQGLIPLKMHAKGGGVNFSAGLSLVRVSPDHGTAFSIAGKGVADCSSTVEAIRMARTIIGNRRKNVTQIA